MNRTKTMQFNGKGAAWKADYTVTHKDKVNAKQTVFQDELGGKLKLQYVGKAPLGSGRITYRLEDRKGRFSEGEIIAGTDDAGMKETLSTLDYSSLLDMMDPDKELILTIDWGSGREQFLLTLPPSIGFGRVPRKR